MCRAGSKKRLRAALPPDIELRLADLGDAIASASADVDFAYVFGSVVAGRQTPRSDVDLAIHVAGHSDGRAVRLDVARAASRHLGTDAVDVVLLNAAPIALAGRVLT